MDRRKFLQYGFGGIPALLGLSQLGACSRDPLAHITGSIVGANAATGHLLRNPSSIPAPSGQREVGVLIVGGGIAGLSARRWLQHMGVADVAMLEMDNRAGGNSAYGRNEVSAYPWGAHYLPVPDVRNKELVTFLEQCGVITGYSASGSPVYNEYHLCHDPEERLFINGHWQEGLVPEFGVPTAEKKQMQRFFQAMEAFKQAKGADGRDAFAIPVDASSADDRFRMLDKLSFAAWLQQEGYTSPYLGWYLAYCCKDDYGCNLQNTSAWAGIHYFASRKGTGANVNTSSVLTWPEGNGFLMERLKKQANTPVHTDHLAYDVHIEGGTVLVKVYNAIQKTSILYNTKKLLLAGPQFVNKRLLQNVAGVSSRNTFAYAPWMTAALTLNGMPKPNGTPLCWDNVLYNTPSVGYINANHQDLNNSTKKVLSFYLPLTEKAPHAARQEAYGRSYRDWLQMIVAEMEYAHTGITKNIAHADIWLWGHGMIAPSPGFIWGGERAAAAQAIDNRIFFAHSDLSGISIFEEAFYQGIRAANEIAASL